MLPSTGKRIVFTGGSGKAGRHCLDYLLSQGHEVLNLDLIPLDNTSVYTLKTDLTDSGQVRFTQYTLLLLYMNVLSALLSQYLLIHFL